MTKQRPDLPLPPNIKCLLFDLDGTLIDTIDLIYRSFRYAVQQVLGRDLPREVLLRNVGRPLAEQMRLLSPERAEELLDAYNRYNLDEHDALIKEYPGTGQVLAELKSRGYATGVVTSKRRAVTLRGLERCELTPFIDVVIAADDSHKHKPEPEPVFLAMERLGARPGDTLFVGDSPFDMMAGKAAGVYTAAALWGPFDPDILRELQPDLVLNRLDELLSVLPEQAGGASS